MPDKPLIIVHYDHRPKLTRKAKAAQPFPVGRIVSGKPPRKRHYGEVIGRVTPPDYEAATEQARQIIGRRLGPDQS
jgi:hypothetical protein